MDPIYFTSPIYYPNDEPHIGTAYTTIAADVLTRWMRLKGRETFFLTGLDEHGKKIENAALNRGMTPKDLVDSQAEVFKKVFALLEVKYDRFIRTTDPDHKQAVLLILQKVFDNGDIFKGTYQGLYCVDCEAYYTEKELIGRNCPVHMRPVDLLSEDCYYFRLSKYRRWLLDFYEKNPEFIQPPSRRKEVISFVSEGLEDLNISRSNMTWGIPLPFDKDQVTYVWFDALINYITGIGFIEDPGHFKKFWPYSVHLIGKDILRFHAIIWPAMLKAAEIDPPNKVFAHGFWTVDGKKFSKSLGNAISPIYLINSYGLDSLRYYMFRAFPFGADGNFVEADLVQRNNSELAQGLGNLVQRTTGMIERYCQGRVPPAGDSEEKEQRIASYAGRTIGDVTAAMDEFALHKALDRIVWFVSQLNSYTNESQPWVLAEKGEIKALHTTLATLVEGIRLLAVLISSFMPVSGEEILRRLGLTKIERVDQFSLTPGLSGNLITHDKPIFPILKMGG